MAQRLGGGAIPLSSNDNNIIIFMWSLPIPSIINIIVQGHCTTQTRTRYPVRYRYVVCDMRMRYDAEARAYTYSYRYNYIYMYMYVHNYYNNIIIHNIPPPPVVHITLTCTCMRKTYLAGILNNLKILPCTHTHTGKEALHKYAIVALQVSNCHKMC